MKNYNTLTEYKDNIDITAFSLDVTPEVDQSNTIFDILDIIARLQEIFIPKPAFNLLPVGIGI